VTTDRREALLVAAEHAILADGYAGASTRRIAQEAGVPLSLLHYHFGGKEGLLIALIERARDRTRDAVRASMAETGAAPRSAVAALEIARRTFLGDTPAAPLLLELAVAALHSPPLRAEVRRLYAEAIAALGATVAELTQDSDRSARSSMSPNAAGSLLIAAGFGLALQRKLGVEPGAADEGFAALVRMVVGESGA
jgi:AcrR family transcriptional regulator